MRTSSYWKWKFGLMFLVLGAAIVAVVMLLWNALLPNLFGIPQITYIQAAGILILSKILFGSWNKKQGHSWHGKNHWMHDMKSKWENMSPDQKEHFKARWGWMEKQEPETNFKDTSKE